jgi:fatty-acyl-CoA synthase
MTHFTAVPTIFQMMTELKEFAAADFSSLEHVQVAGGWSPDWLFDVLSDKGVTLQPHYGATETGPAVTALPMQDALTNRDSVGRPVPHVQVRLVGSGGETVHDGEVGEVWVRGPSITPGYWKRDRRSDEAFAGSWFRTGDAARVDESGFYYLVDRFKDMYKSGGENVFPAEVERVIADHPAVAAVAVIGTYDEKWGEVGKAIVVPRAGKAVTVESLRQHCEQRLARYKIPRSLVIVDELPRTNTGKVNKLMLRESFARSPGTAAPRRDLASRRCGGLSQ